MTENFYAADAHPGRPDDPGRGGLLDGRRCPPGRCSSGSGAGRPMGEAIHCVDDVAERALLLADPGGAASPAASRSHRDSQVPARFRPAADPSAGARQSCGMPTSRRRSSRGHQKKTAVAAAAGVIALGAGHRRRRRRLGRPHAHAQPSAATAPRRRPRGPTDRVAAGATAAATTREHGQELASKLGRHRGRRSPRRCRPSARRTGRPPSRPGGPPTRGSATPPWRRRWPRSWASTRPRSTTALAEIRAARQAERAAALKERLDAAVADGTLTQAEADAVTKAVEKGVIGGGGRGKEQPAAARASVRYRRGADFKRGRRLAGH